MNNEELPPKVNDNTFSWGQEETVFINLNLRTFWQIMKCLKIPVPVDECKCDNSGSHPVFPKPCIRGKTGKDKRYSWRDNPVEDHKFCCYMNSSSSQLVSPLLPL
jgi:hypothetical protein